MKTEVFDYFLDMKSQITEQSCLKGRKIAKLLFKAWTMIKLVSLDRVLINPRIEMVYGDQTDLSFYLWQTEKVDCILNIKGWFMITRFKLFSHLYH